jgi:hypothetical protein
MVLFFTFDFSFAAQHIIKWKKYDAVGRVPKIEKS